MAEAKFTAFGAAMARAAGTCDPHVASTDSLAAPLLPRRFRWGSTWPLLRGLTLRYIEHIAPGVYLFHNARTKRFDRLLLDAIGGGARQFVILGAGLDSRAYRFARELAGVRVFELDFPATAAWKRKQVKHLGLPSAHVTFVDVDFTVETIAEALARAGWDPSQPTFFLWEGVTAYLPARAIDETFRFVAQAAPGSSIAFDYLFRAAFARPRDFFGAVQAFRWVETHGEPYLFGVDPGEVGALVERSGLELVSNVGPDELRQLLPKKRAPFADYMGIALARRA
jgi:methyltransferase (TIGR00027 family)